MRINLYVLESNGNFEVKIFKEIANIRMDYCENKSENLTLFPIKKMT